MYLPGNGCLGTRLAMRSTITQAPPKADLYTLICTQPTFLVALSSDDKATELRKKPSMLFLQLHGSKALLVIWVGVAWQLSVGQATVIKLRHICFFCLISRRPKIADLSQERLFGHHPSLRSGPFPLRLAILSDD